LIIISIRKTKTDNEIPTPKIKNAAVRSKRVKDLVFVSGGTSVRHLSVVGKYFFLQRSTSPPAFKRRNKLSSKFNHNKIINQKNNLKVLIIPIEGMDKGTSKRKSYLKGCRFVFFQFG